MDENKPTHPWRCVQRTHRAHTVVLLDDLAGGDPPPLPGPGGGHAVGVQRVDVAARGEDVVAVPQQVPARGWQHVLSVQRPQHAVQLCTEGLCVTWLQPHSAIPAHSARPAHRMGKAFGMAGESCWGKGGRVQLSSVRPYHQLTSISLRQSTIPPSTPSAMKTKEDKTSTEKSNSSLSSGFIYQSPIKQPNPAQKHQAAAVSLSFLKKWQNLQHSKDR